MNLTKKELDERLLRFIRATDESCPGWDTAVILGRVNQYYFTGTMQDGMLVIKKNGTLFYFVRRSYERAKDESRLASIYPMTGYRDAAAVLGAEMGNTCMETELVTVGIVTRLRKYFKFGEIIPLDSAIQSVRAVKSPYELALIKQSGKVHEDFLVNVVPSLLREGIIEADFTAELYANMVKHGYHGISRFAMFQTEMVAGQIGFGENSLYPTSFDGPGGNVGISPAVPLLGSRHRRLKYGDLVFVDIGFGMNGYHTDKTQVYQYGGRPPEEAVRAHSGCIEVQKRIAGMLRPGAVPSQIYKIVMSELNDDFKADFMGFKNRCVQFLGHGIGLHVDEPPVIAEGFRAPLKENMVIAIEPKKGISGVGMVGVEDTYVVASDGGECVTGGGKEIMIL